MKLLQRKFGLRQLMVVSFVLVAFAFLVQHNDLTEQLDRQEFGILAGRHIAIDPGHGGIDGGVSRYGLIEKEINLQISSKLATLLRDHGAIVVMTRDSDIDYYTKGKGGKKHDLLQRVAIIQESGVELFVSIHTNAGNDSRWSGSQVFFNPKNVQNKLLGETVQAALRNFPPGNKREVKQDSDILVLNANNVPGVLVETGFLSNRREAILLADEHYQEELVLRIAKALSYHLDRNVVQ